MGKRVGSDKEEKSKKIRTEWCLLNFVKEGHLWSLLEEFHWRAERGRRLHYIMSNDELNMSTRGRVNLETHFFQMPGLEKGEREISKIKGGYRGWKTVDSE